MKRIYSLGGGCWVYSDIPEEFRMNSIFKAFWAEKPSVFLPLEIFNGNLEEEFLRKDGNWDVVNVNKGWEQKQIELKKSKDETYVSNYLLTYDILNKNNGWCIRHPHAWKTNPTNKYTFKPMFDEFNANKYNMLYIIDFQRGGYEKYTNQQLLEFEDFLTKHNFVLQNFIYLDVDDAEDKNRFLNCNIPVFVQNVQDSSGFGFKYTEDRFRNTRCFFANHMDYVKERLEHKEV